MTKKQLINKNTIIIAVILVVLIGGLGVWYVLDKGQKSANYFFVPVSKGSLTKEIKASGVVKPAEEINLSFERGGKIKMASIKTGDQVKTGQVLLELDNSDVAADLSQTSAGIQIAEAQLKQLEAALEIQKIKKTEMLNGARPEDVQISQIKKDNAEKSVLDAEANLANVKTKADIDLRNITNNISNLLQDATAKSFDAVNRQTDGMFNNSSSNNPELTFNTPLNLILKSSVESKKVLANSAVDKLALLPTMLNTDNSNSLQLADSANKELLVVRDFLINLNSALNATVLSVDLNQTKLSLYKSSISTALNNINSNITNLQNYPQLVAGQGAVNLNSIKLAEIAVNNAKNLVIAADSELLLKKSGATREQLASQDAQIMQAEANLETQRAQISVARANSYKISTMLEKTIIKSPIDGTVSKFELAIGESVLPGTPAINLITVAKFKVESFIPEAELANLKIGNSALVSLDSYENKEYEAKIILIDPTSSIVNGSSVYKVTLEFDQEDSAIKAGLTANAKLLSDTEKDVMIISTSSVIKDGYEQYVIVDNGTATGEKRKIKTGNIVQDGKIAVLSGLAENEKIADFANSLIK